MTFISVSDLLLGAGRSRGSVSLFDRERKEVVQGCCVHLFRIMSETYMMCERGERVRPTTCADPLADGGRKSDQVWW